MKCIEQTNCHCIWLFCVTILDAQIGLDGMGMGMVMGTGVKK